MEKLSLTDFDPICAKDFFYHAEKNIRPDLFTYFQSGATNEITLAENENAFKRFLFIPKMLRDVSKRNLKSDLLGFEIEHPFGIAPSASQKIANLEGEIATARAAAQTGTPMVLSTLSSVKLEDVASTYYKNFDGPQKPALWFQLYVFKNRILTESLIKRAELSGYTAIMVTIDTPLSGIRYANLRYRLAFPDNINYANVDEFFKSSNSPKNNFFAEIAVNLDDSLTWNGLMTYLRSVTNLPIIVKGVLSVEDAQLAVNHGAQGILVSNHGARQLDTVPPTLESLIKIAPHVPKDVELYLDGGIRCGDDIVKALALGAKTVFIGRPVLWALSYGGSEGVKKLITILRTELDASLALNGINDVNNVPRNLVVRASEYNC